MSSFRHAKMPFSIGGHHGRRGYDHIIRQGELKRLHVIQKVLERVIKQVEAAEILSLSGRQIRRIVKRIRDEGNRGVIHKSRGRPSVK
jgi:transposase